VRHIRTIAYVTSRICDSDSRSGIPSKSANDNGWPADEMPMTAGRDTVTVSVSKTTIALEALVADVIANRAEADAKQTGRQRLNTDRAFASILKLIAPRIRHFTRQYGLVAYWEDAEQAAAIAVHRAIEAYDPEKAQFTTFVNWQIRGEMQSLRFRLMTDQRSSAKKVEAFTVSLQDLGRSHDGEDLPFESTIEDEDALGATEAAASAYLAQGATSALIDDYIDHLRQVGIEQLKKRPRAKKAIAEQPAGIKDQLPVRRPRFREIDPVELARLEEKLVRNREIVERRVFEAGTLDALALDTDLTKERVRQITKRAARTMGELVASSSKFQVMADYKTAAANKATARTATGNVVSIGGAIADRAEAEMLETRRAA
jgi:DNA-directed RNA polymerase specialized sigma subunit